MKSSIVLLLVAVVISTNVSANLILGSSQMNAYAQTEENQSDVNLDNKLVGTNSPAESNMDLSDATIGSSTEPAEGTSHTGSSDTTEVDSSDTTEVDSSDTTEVDSSDTTEVDSSDTTEVDSSDTTEVDSSDTTGTDNSDTTEVDSSESGEVGSSDFTEVGTIDKSDPAAAQNQDNTNDLAATQDPEELKQAIAAHKILVDAAFNGVEAAADNLKDSLKELVAEYADKALAAGNDAGLRAIAKAQFFSKLNTLTGSVGSAAEIVRLSANFQPVPSQCNPGDPSCNPNPEPEPAACDPQIVGNCSNLGQAPCAPAEVSGAQCVSGELTCTQAPIKYVVSCRADFDDGGSVQIAYHTPPGGVRNGQPHIIEQTCVPNSNPPPARICTSIDNLL